ncbi:MAG: AAA family ATPase, partial [Clostridiales bacterium]|nr:AAA family ATPase [Clostridiales bacterium]
MLLNLHVKNFALIEEADIDFGEGLNILTGETGAGKSILIDAVNAALGGRIRGSVIRAGCDSAYVELMFSVPESEKQEALRAMDISTEYDCIVVSRKILAGRSVHKINDETVTSAKVRQATALLMDIHGQHEHQSLMNRQKHLDILDQYGGQILENQRQVTSLAWQKYRNACQEWESFQADEEFRRREMDFLQFEIQEIEAAAIKPGETEELEQQYRRVQNSRRICQSLQKISGWMGENPGSASDQISSAARELAEIRRLDDDLVNLEEELTEIEDLLSGFCRELDDYMESLDFREEEVRDMEERLDLLHHLESKYGSGWDAIEKTLREKQQKLEEWQEYDIRKQQAEKEMLQAKEKYENASEILSQLRRKAAPGLEASLKEGIQELNFSYVDFQIHFSRSEHPGKLGIDEVEFLISLNEGQPAQSLGQVASGGELSRIMLAIKAVLA